MRSALLSIVVPVFLGVAACGGSVDVADGSGGGGTTASTTTSSATTGAVGTTAAPSSAATGTSSSDGGAGTSGQTDVSVSSGEGGASAVSVGQGGAGPGTGSSGVTTAASTGSGTEPFVCGQVECAAGEQCCASQQGFACIGPNDPCQGATLTCQSAANCSDGQICCLQGDFQNAESVCADQCEAGPAGPIQLCATDDECPPGVPCQDAFGGFKVCTNGFPGGP